jgi:hypothetical protein
MKKLFVVLPLALLAAFASLTGHAQGTAFTYQGRLNLNSNAANGNYDFQFILFNVPQFGFPVGPILTNANVTVNNGLFTTTLDFGGGIFTGTNLWLDISVRTNGGGVFSELLPRQPLTPAPYAAFANTASNLSGTLPVTQIAGTLALTQLPGVVVTNGASGVNLTGAFAGNATGFTGPLAGDVTGTQGATVVGMVGGSTAANVHAAELLANAATSTNTANTIVKRDASGNFTAPLALALPNLRTEASQNGFGFLSANLIGGASVNTVAPGVSGAVIAGGGASGGFPQQISANYSVIGGGYSDTITTGGAESVIAGGAGNTASAGDVAIGGGYGNTGSALYATVGGGNGNTASGNGATVGGGGGNTASGFTATIPGGNVNVASGWTSFAAGNRAKAIHNGAFVWGDSTAADVTSTADNQMTIRASGGVVLNTAGGGVVLNTTNSGVTLNAATGVALAVNATAGASVPVGTLYRDNTVVAWGRVSGNVLTDKFNVASVVRNSAGNYTVTLNTSFTGTALVPVVSVAHIGAQPTTAASCRIASTGQLLSSTAFNVYINSGTFVAADADFTFVVTGR